jgi:hypothetical protein
MANLKITELDADTTPTADDLIVTVNAPGTTPVNKKITIDNLDDYLKSTEKTLTNKEIDHPTGSVLGQSATAIGTDSINTSSATFVDMTNMSITITTTGGNCLVLFSAPIDNNGKNLAQIRIVIDSTVLQTQEIYFPLENKDYACSITGLATSVAAGSHTFKVQWLTSAGTVTQYGNAFKRNLTVIELPN